MHDTRPLIDRMRELGWERMSPVFAFPAPSAAGDFRGVRIPDGPAFSTRRQARSAVGTRTMTLRTLDLDFELVGRERLRKAGVGQRLYSIGHALHGRELLPGVLLAQGWVRPEYHDPDPLLDMLRGRFAHLAERTERIDRALVRFRLAAWGAADAD